MTSVRSRLSVAHVLRYDVGSSVAVGSSVDQEKQILCWCIAISSSSSSSASSSSSQQHLLSVLGSSQGRKQSWTTCSGPPHYTTIVESFEVAFRSGQVLGLGVKFKEPKGLGRDFSLRVWITNVHSYFYLWKRFGGSNALFKNKSTWLYERQNCWRCGSNSKALACTMFNQAKGWYSSKGRMAGNFLWMFCGILAKNIL